MPQDITVDAPSPPPGGSSLVRMTFSNPPTLADLERLLAERWHTRPAWLYDGTFAARKIVEQDPLPSGASYNASDNRITIPSGTTITDLSGWDFLETQTTILLQGTARILNFENNRMAPRYTTKAQRLTQQGGANPCIQFELNSTARIDRMARCQFTQHPLHEGIGGPGMFILAQTNNNASFAKVDVMEFCSFEGYDYDAIKGAWAGIRRYCYLDPARNMSDDATEWDSNATYNRGDVVWGGSNLRPRLCRNNGVTSAPNFSGATTSTADWAALDPHSDTDQPSATPQNEDVVWWGSVFIRDQGHRRFPSRQVNRGVVNALRYIANSSSQDIGPTYVRYCLFTEEVELFASNKHPIEFATADRSYGGTPKVAEFNWYQQRLVLNTGAHITVRNNISGWDFPAPATLSSVSASYSGGALTYGFTPSKGGWMRVVVTTTNSGLTARQIVSARNGDTGVLGIFEIDAPANTAVTGAIAIASGQTVYAQAVYQHGGGVYTIAPVQAVGA